MMLTLRRVQSKSHALAKALQVLAGICGFVAADIFSHNGDPGWITGFLATGILIWLVSVPINPEQTKMKQLIFIAIQPLKDRPVFYTGIAGVVLFIIGIALEKATSLDVAGALTWFTGFMCFIYCVGKRLKFL